MEELKDIIVNKRTEMKMSRRELARRINIDQAYLSRIEKGTIKKPSVIMLFKLCNQLKLNYWNILTTLYNEQEMDALSLSSNMNEICHLANDELIEKVLIKDDFDNNRISIVKILELFKQDKLTLNETINLLSVLTNKFLIDGLTKEEYKKVKNSIKE